MAARSRNALTGMSRRFDSVSIIGANPTRGRTIAIHGELEEFLSQKPDERGSFDDGFVRLATITTEGGSQ